MWCDHVKPFQLGCKKTKTSCFPLLWTKIFEPWSQSSDFVIQNENERGPASYCGLNSSNDIIKSDVCTAYNEVLLIVFICSFFYWLWRLKPDMETILLTCLRYSCATLEPKPVFIQRKTYFFTSSRVNQKHLGTSWRYDKYFLAMRRSICLFNRQGWMEKGAGWAF